MILVGLTGGIGAGKSTVSSLLADRGAEVVDADRITREVQQPGTPVFEAIVDRFGSDVVAADGTLDRQALADVVFGDDEARRALQEIVWPAVGARMAERVAELAETDAVVIYDVPLLVEAGRRGMAGVIVVDAPVDVCVQRVVKDRGMSEADARARIASQVSREERLAAADFVVDNSGSLEDLEHQVDNAWKWIQTLSPDS